MSELAEQCGTENTEGEALTALRQLRQRPHRAFTSIHPRYLEYRSQIPYRSDAMEMNAITLYPTAT